MLWVLCALGELLVQWLRVLCGLWVVVDCELCVLIRRYVVVGVCVCGCVCVFCLFYFSFRIPNSISSVGLSRSKCG